jgi:hypothetical protein
MSEFNPDQPARLHDRLAGHFVEWRSGWAHDWRQYARANKVDGTVAWDGMILDGWEPLGSS